MFPKRYVVSIVEQPAKKHRFRYASEINNDRTRTVGSIPGVHDSPANRTYPTIRVEGYSGPMLVMLCLINPHNKLVHPHAITGREFERGNDKCNFNKGIMKFYTNGPEVIFENIGILCVRGKKREDIVTALRLRQEANIDPFRKGFPHMQNHDLIDLAAVRLCFNVFLPVKELTGDDLFDHQMYTQPLHAVLSDVIYDVKKANDLKIVELLECSGSMRGGTKIVLFCGKYNKDPPPEVVFVGPGWTDTAHVFKHHMKTTLVFHTPPYRDPKCSQEVEVKVYLRKENANGDMEYSDPAVFTYIPEQKVQQQAKKRPPPDYSNSKLQKRTLVQEYLDSKVPYPQPAAEQFLEIPPSKHEYMASSSSYAAQPQTPDIWQQPSTSSNPHFLPQPSHFLNTHTNTNIKENVTRKQTVNEPNHQNYVNTTLDQNIFAMSSFDANLFQSNYNTQQAGAINVMPNVVPENFLHYDQTPDVISGTYGGEIRDDFPLDEDLFQLGNALVDFSENPFLSNTDAEMLSGELKNLQC